MKETSFSLQTQEGKEATHLFLCHPGGKDLLNYVGIILRRLLVVPKGGQRLVCCPDILTWYPKPSHSTA